jgi:hypothetical protein
LGDFVDVNAGRPGVSGETFLLCLGEIDFGVKDLGFFLALTALGKNLVDGLSVFISKTDPPMSIFSFGDAHRSDDYIVRFASSSRGLHPELFVICHKLVKGGLSISGVARPAAW